MKRDNLKTGLVILAVGIVFLLSQNLNGAIEGEGVWLFDEGTGLVVRDSSLNHKDGYLGDSRLTVP